MLELLGADAWLLVTGLEGDDVLVGVDAVDDFELFCSRIAFEDAGVEDDVDEDVDEVLLEDLDRYEDLEFAILSK